MFTMVFIKSHKEELSLEGDELPLKSHEINSWEPRISGSAEVLGKGMSRGRNTGASEVCSGNSTPCWASMDCKGGK